jgi:chromosome segregation ATPase
MASRALSLAENNRGIDSEAQVGKTNEMSNGKFYSKDDISELKNVIANVLANINNSKKELQDKMKMNNRELKEINKTLQNLDTSNRELRESNDKLQRDTKTKLERSQENTKTELKTETEKWTQRNDREIQNSDVSLRRQGERVEQVQLQAHQERVTVENKIGKISFPIK